jgi:hypothetical protein
MGIPQNLIGFVHQRTQAKAKQRILDAFMRMPSESDTEKLQYPDYIPRYLIGAVSVLKTGLTLTEAVHATLFEPQYSSLDEMQYFARHSRPGQKNPKTFTRKYYMGDSKVESAIMDRHRVRKHLEPAMKQSVAERDAEGLDRTITRESTMRERRGAEDDGWAV